MMTVSTVRRDSEDLRGEQQVEGFGGGDEDFGGSRAEAGALLLRGVAGADADLGVVDGDAHAAGHVGDAGERGAQVAFDVDGEGFERGDVDDAAALALRGRCWSMRRSRHQRKAVRVLPVPVGARIRVLSPRAMAGQPGAAGRWVRRRLR